MQLLKKLFQRVEIQLLDLILIQYSFLKCEKMNATMGLLSTLKSILALLEKSLWVGYLKILVLPTLFMIFEIGICNLAVCKIVGNTAKVMNCK